MKHIVGYEWLGFSEDQKLKLFHAKVEACQPGLSEMFKMPSRKPWVAELTGLSQKFKFERQFVKGQFEGSEANGKFSRGIKLYFIVEEGRPYQVCYFTSWRNKEKYFCVWLDGKETKVSEEFVTQWLKSRLE